MAKTPAPTAKPAEVTPPSPEKKSDTKAIESFAGSILNIDPPRQEKKPDEKPITAAPAPVRKKPAAPATAPAPTAKEIATAVATEVATALKPIPVEEKKAPELELPPIEQKRLTNLKHMESLFPDKYKGISEKYKANLAKLAEYAAEWEKQNPGREFNEDDDEHKAFYDANNVDWEDEDYTEAVADIRARKASAEVEEKYKGKFDEIETARKVNEALPVIEKAKVIAARGFFAGVNGEFADFVNENGVPNAEKMKALQESDPIVYSIVVGDAEQLEKLTAENYLLFSGFAKFDEKRPEHSMLNSFIIEKEQKLAARPAAEQLNGEGKPFLPAARYWKLPEDQRSAYWTFTRGDVESLLVKNAIKSTKAAIDSEEKKFAAQAKARGLTVPAKSAKAAPAAVIEEEDEPQNGKPVSPGAPSSGRLPAGGKREEDSNPAKLFTKSFVGV